MSWDLIVAATVLPLFVVGHSFGIEYWVKGAPAREALFNALRTGLFVTAGVAVLMAVSMSGSEP